MARRATHIVVYAADAVMAAHDSNYLHTKIRLIRLVRLAQNGIKHRVENDWGPGTIENVLQHKVSLTSSSVGRARPWLGRADRPSAG